MQKVVSVVFVVSVVGALLSLLILKSKARPRKWLVASFIVAAAACIAAYPFLRQRAKRVDAAQKQTIIEKQLSNLGPVSKPTSAATGKLADYEVVSVTDRQVIVFTKEKDDAKLVQLNDQLYNKYKSDKPSLQIDYFDDKDVAKRYFADIAKTTTSSEEKQRLFSHYKAYMLVNSLAKKIELVKTGPPITTLKKY